MDFEPTEATREVIERFQTFVERELEPLEGELSGAPFGSIEPTLEGLREKVRSEGLWAPNLPTELGGMGLGLVDHGLVSEVLGGYPYAHYVFGCQAPDAGTPRPVFSRPPVRSLPSITPNARVTHGLEW